MGTDFFLLRKPGVDGSYGGDSAHGGSVQVRDWESADRLSRRQEGDSLGADPNAVPVPGSNTPPPPTQVIVFDTSGSTGTTLPIAGATAADFSRTV